MEESQRSALRLAQWLESQPRVRRVWYPGLPSHPGYDLHRRQSSGDSSRSDLEVQHSLALELEKRLEGHIFKRLIHGFFQK